MEDLKKRTQSHRAVSTEDTVAADNHNNKSGNNDDDDDDNGNDKESCAIDHFLQNGLLRQRRRSGRF